MLGLIAISVYPREDGLLFGIDAHAKHIVHITPEWRKVHLNIFETIWHDIFLKFIQSANDNHSSVVTVEGIYSSSILDPANAPCLSFFKVTYFSFS